MYLRIARPQRHRLLQVGFGFFDLALVEQNLNEAAQRRQIIGPERKRLLVGNDRFLAIPFELQQVGEIVVRFGVGRFERYRSSKCLLRIGRLPAVFRSTPRLLFASALSGSSSIERRYASIASSSRSKD